MPFDPQVAFYTAFLAQILLISYFLPRQLLHRMQQVIERYPPASYPRLYPVSLERTDVARRTYRNLNRGVLLLGLGLVALGALSPSDEMLGWDTLSVMTLFLLLQFAPTLMVATRPGFIYFNRHRLPDQRRTRSAELIPLGIPDVVSGGTLLVVVSTYAAFCVFVLWVRQFDYPWFGGYANIVGITGMNLFMWGCLAYGLYGRRRDPYTSIADRRRSLRLTARILAFTSVAATLSITISIVFAMLELREFIPAAKSVYFMLLAWVSFQEFRIDGVDFEVYREEPARA